MNEMKKISLLLLIIVFISLIIRLIIAWTDVPTLIEKIMVDDTFYGFSISRNIANQNGITYNGVTPTNGFQPLWVFLISTFFLLIHDTYLVINFILTFAAIIDTLTVLIIFKFAKRIFKEKPAIIAASLYGLNPLIIFQTLSGLEVVLYTFFVTIILYFYYLVKDKLDIRNIFILGLLIGLSTLTRTDSIFLFLAIALHILWKSRKDLKNGFKKCFIIGAVMLLPLLPWFLWSYFTFGTIVQSSAIARYNYNHGIAPLLYQSPFGELRFLEAMRRFLGAFLHQLGVINFSFYSIWVLLPTFLIIILILSLKNLKKLSVGIIFAIFLFIFYGIYFLGVQIRYVTPIIPIFIILLSANLYLLSNKILKNNFLFYLISLILITIIIFNGYQKWNEGYLKWQTPLFKNALWAKENTTPDTIMGSFNSGILSFFSERNVINLDGVLDFNSIKAIYDKNVLNYMKNNNISIWIDISFFNETVYYGYKNNSIKIDILKDNLWKDVLGEGKLYLIDEKIEGYEHLTGFKILAVFFIAKLE